MSQASPHIDDISLVYFKKDFDKYSWSAFYQDLTAGLSVAMLTVPQAMAYSLVAGLPLFCGLLAAIFSAAIVAIFGSSRHLIVGPSNSIAILIQAGISEIFFTYYRNTLEVNYQVLGVLILTQLALLVGVIQILAAFFRLGRLTHFVSYSVIIGYISGVALALIINQSFVLLGISVPDGVKSLYERGLYIFTHLYLIHWPTAVIGITCFTALMVLKRVDRKIPAGAIMLATIALITYLFEYIFSFLPMQEWQFWQQFPYKDLLQGIALVGDIGDVGLIPQLNWPHFNTGMVNNLLSIAFAIALLSVMETTSTAKSIAANSGQRLSVNQEIFALGMGNLFSAFIGAMPVSGSPSRTYLNYSNGARTRLASIFNSLWVAIILFAFGFLIGRIPITAFAALLIFSSLSIVNLKQVFMCLKATRSDAFVLLTTILSCIFFSLDIAFYIGVVMSITLYLKKAAIPQLAEFSIDETGHLYSLDPAGQQQSKPIRFIKVEGELFFGAADLFHTALKSIAEDDTTTHVIILELKNARDIDATACLALKQLYDYLQSSGRCLIGCGITHPIWGILSDSGLIDLIGKANLFIFDERQPRLSIQKAFRRAQELLILAQPKADPASALATQDSLAADVVVVYSAESSAITKTLKQEG